MEIFELMYALKEQLALASGCVELFCGIAGGAVWKHAMSDFMCLWENKCWCLFFPVERTELASGWELVNNQIGKKLGLSKVKHSNNWATWLQLCCIAV